MEIVRNVRGVIQTEGEKRVDFADKIKLGMAFKLNRGKEENNETIKKQYRNTKLIIFSIVLL